MTALETKVKDPNWPLKPLYDQYLEADGNPTESGFIKYAMRLAQIKSRRGMINTATAIVLEIMKLPEATHTYKSIAKPAADTHDNAIIIGFRKQPSKDATTADYTDLSQSD